jgi:hypothetical protein
MIRVGRGQPEILGEAIKFAFAVNSQERSIISEVLHAHAQDCVQLSAREMVIARI